MVRSGRRTVALKWTRLGWEMSSRAQKGTAGRQAVGLKTVRWTRDERLCSMIDTVGSETSGRA